MPPKKTSVSGNSGEGLQAPTVTAGAQGASISSSNDHHMYHVPKSTKLNLEPLTPDGDFTAFEEAFRAEMKVRRLAHHFPGLIKENLAQKFKEADNNPFSAMDAHSLLIMALHPDVRSTVREYAEDEDPSLLWQELVKIRKSTNDTTVAKVANQAQTAQQGQSEPLATFINRLDTLHRRVKGTDYEMNGKMMWLNVIRGLLPMFVQIAREITRDSTKDSYIKRRTDLLVTATDYVGDPHKPPSTTYEGRALNVQEGNDSKKKKKDKTKKGKNNKKKDLSLKCTHCNWKGHLLEDCPNKDKTDRCTHCKKIGHSASNCKSKAAKEEANNVNDSDNDPIEFGFTADEEPSAPKCEECTLTEEWIVDSGASSHFKNSPDGLTSTQTDGQNSIRVGDNRKLTIKSTGTHHKSYMGKVKHVPGLARNLMSVGAITDEPNTAVIFQGGTCVIHKGAKITVDGGEVLGEGSKNADRLYRIHMDQPDDTDSDAAGDTDSETASDTDTDTETSDDAANAADGDSDNDSDSENDYSDGDCDSDFTDGDCSDGYTIDGSAIELHKIHTSLNHLSKSGIKHLQRMGKISATKKVLAAQLECPACNGGKSHKHNRRKKNIDKIRAEATGDLIYSDACGPFQVPDIDGHVYFQTYIDGRCRVVAAYLMQQKDAETTVANTKHFTARLQARGYNIRRLRTDQGGEYINHEMKTYLASQGIVHEITGRGASQQNGVAERMNRTILDTVRTILIASGLPHKWWGHAVKYTTMVRNRVTTGTFKHKEIPWERFTLKPVDLGRFRPFGCKAWVHEHDNSALDPRGLEGIFVGFDEELLHSLVYLPGENRIVRSADVTFAVGDNSLLRETTSVVDMPTTTRVSRSTKAAKTEATKAKNTKAAGAATRARAAGAASAPSSTAGVPEQGEKSDKRNYSTTPTDTTLTCLTYEEAALHALQCLARDIPVPSTYEAAISDPVYGEYWKKAFKSELQSHKDQRTYEVCDLPKGRKVLQTRWVLKVKEGENGQVDKFKCRWVVKGFSQIPGVDYELTFAPVSRLTSFRVLLAYAAATGMLIHQMDVATAFLYADLQEDVYVHAPPGLRKSVPNGKVLKLLKAVFGLKQSPRAWNKCLDEFLQTKAGMTPLH